MNRKELPGWVHVFVCVNDRHGEKRSCADGDAAEIRARLKAVAKERGWWNRTVRISQTGCLGLCQQGPNVLIHPGRAHFNHVSLADLDDIVREIAAAVALLSKD